LNYEYFASSNPALCKYVSDITPTSTTSKYLFKRSLESGSKGDDVKALQKFLNANGYIVAKSGSGSKGSETTTFGPATKSALIKFQKAKGITPALGYFGPLTRGVVGK
jgi:peptidoglycan hydrolase-like protein with peptidoglycan-binding domain